MQHPRKDTNLLFTPDKDPTKYSATYLTNDKVNSVKCDVRLREEIFDPVPYKYTEVDPVSGIRYPTIHHLIALKIVSFIERGDGKKEKDLQDIFDLTEEVFVEDRYQDTMSSELIGHYLGTEVMNRFMDIVGREFKEKMKHMEVILIPMVGMVKSESRGPKYVMNPALGQASQGAHRVEKSTQGSSSVARSTQGTSSVAKSTQGTSSVARSTQGASTVVRSKQESATAAKSTQAVRRTQGTSSTSAAAGNAAAATKTAGSKKVETGNTGAHRGTGIYLMDSLY